MSAAVTTGAVLLEARPFRPFKSSEEYLFAMKEDLAEWLMVLYPELMINADNFLDRLDTGVVLCRHANAVRESAIILLTTPEPETNEALVLARTLRNRAPLSLLPAAKPGTFFARDNVSNFIEWCRRALGVLECLLFETDDLCLRKNEKHVVLCLLEVARRGAVLGMPAPLLVQMEKQIERELAGEDSSMSDSALGLVPFGPQPQLVTNDLRSLDERVRDLVERCSCPTQFPMVRVSEGKYRIGDTKILIFVRILRSHVMVRVGGGWDTLSHYLDKHDPCRCRSQHRQTFGAKLYRPNKPYAELNGSTVTYDRADPAPLPEYITVQDRSRVQTEEPMSLPYFHDTKHCSPPRSSEAPARLLPLNQAIRTSASPERKPYKPGVVAANSLVPNPHATRSKSPRSCSPSGPTATTPGGENVSDNGSEVSDEGYRSLGVVCSPPQAKVSNGVAAGNRYSMHSQNSTDDADFSERHEIEEDNALRKTAQRIDDYVSLNTGLRKTDYSGTFYGGKKQSDGLVQPVRRTPERSVSHESNHSPSLNLRARSTSRIPQSPTRNRTPSRPVSPVLKPKTNTSSQLSAGSRNTWNGRSVPNSNKTKTRPSIAADTFESPNKSPKHRPPQSPPKETFRRNTPLRSSFASSKCTPPVKMSPLLEQIYKTAETAKDDAAVLEKMKDIIRQYSKGDKECLSRGSSKESDYTDFTSAWVMSDGKLERSTSTRQLAAPRRDHRNGGSKIPAPATSNGCRRSNSTTKFV